MTEESNKPIGEPDLTQENEAASDEAAEAQEALVAAAPVEDGAAEPEVVSDVPDTEAAESDAPQKAEAADDVAAAESEPEVEESVEPVVPSASSEPEPEAEEDEERKMDWYILKVQSNREDSIRDGLLRRVKIAGLEDFFGEVIVPTEKVTEFKGGKKRVMKRKLYPGYIVVNMEINDDTWFLVRETPGIGDFTGAAGTPTPMLPHEVQRIIAKKEEKQDEVPKLDIGFHVGDRVKINEGTFENFEGEVSKIDRTNGHVEVMINIFGRSTPVELEYWQIESV